MIIGISGKIGSGKDLCGKIIKYLHFYYDVKPVGYGKDDITFVMNQLEKEDSHLINLFSQWEIKKFADKLKDCICIILNCTRYDLEDINFKNTPLGKEWGNLTPRLLLQLLGTDCGRQIIHPNIWINSLFREYNSTKLNWIITDTRFINEFNSIKERNGINIQIISDKSPKDNHISETELDNYNEFNYVIENNKTIEELILKIKEILIKEQII